MSIRKLGPAALAFAAAFLVPIAAFAADEMNKPGANKYDVKTWAAAGAGLAGISRNPGAAPRIQTPMILGLALIESLVLLAFVIAFFLQGLAAAG